MKKYLDTEEKIYEKITDMYYYDRKSYRQLEAYVLKANADGDIKNIASVVFAMLYDEKDSEGNEVTVWQKELANEIVCDIIINKKITKNVGKGLANFFNKNFILEYTLNFIVIAIMILLMFDTKVNPKLLIIVALVLSSFDLYLNIARMMRVKKTNKKIKLIVRPKE